METDTPLVGVLPTAPVAADAFGDWADADKPETDVPPEPAEIAACCADAPEPATATPPEAMDALPACALAALPCAMLPMAPEALDAFGDWVLDAAPLMYTPPPEALVLGFCVAAPLPAINAAPEAEEPLAA